MLIAVPRGYRLKGAKRVIEGFIFDYYLPYSFYLR